MRVAHPASSQRSALPRSISVLMCGRSVAASAGAGASMACAWLSGLAAQYLASGGGVETLRDWLEEKACHRGVDDPRRRQHGD